jgi:hypothetical protein
MNYQTQKMISKINAFNKQMNAKQFTQPTLVDQETLLSVVENNDSEALAMIVTHKLFKEMQSELPGESLYMQTHYYKDGIFNATNISMTKAFTEYLSNKANYRYNIISESGTYQVEIYAINENTICLNHIGAPIGSGMGTEIMSRLMDIADELGINITLVPTWLSKTTLMDAFKNTIRLRAWYAALGFKADRGAYMTYKAN